MALYELSAPCAVCGEPVPVVSTVPELDGRPWRHLACARTCPDCGCGHASPAEAAACCSGPDGVCGDCYGGGDVAEPGGESPSILRSLRDSGRLR